MLSTRSTSLPKLAWRLETVRSTSRPTIIDARADVDASGAASPTTLPRRITVILSATSFTSRSLWVINTMEVPALASWRMIAISSSVSCGVKTAVGSSSTKILASLESALMISTRCWTPTGRSSTKASGSTLKPKRSEISTTRFLAWASLKVPNTPVGSLPKATFSATVKTGISMKCW